MPTERTVLVRLDANPKGFILGMEEAKAAVNDLRKDIDATNNRTSWLAQSFLALAPALGPVSAAAVPALAGIATELTVAGVAAGTATLAFNGIGTALTALNNYQIDPTDAHLKALHKAMAFIGPTGRDLVRVLDGIRDHLIGLANLSRDKMFPGVIAGLHELSSLGPQVEQIVAKIAGKMGELADLGGTELGNGKLKDFFDFLEAEAVPTLDAMARTIGNVVVGLSDMLVAFKPVSDDFTSGMLNMSRAFAAWAHGLRGSENFQQFIDYVREQTPRVLALLGQLADIFVDIVRAASPVGEVMIPLLTDFLKVVDLVANSPLGPVFIAAAAAMSIYGRAVALGSITTKGLTAKVLELSGVLRKLEVEEARAAASTTKLGAATEAGAAKTGAASAKYAVSWKRAAGGAGLLALALSPLPEKLHLTGAAYGALAGSMLGPEGAAIGAVVGQTVQWSAALVEAMSATEKFTSDSTTLASTLNQQTGAVTKNTRSYVLNELAKQGALDAGKLLGLDSTTLVNAYLGESDAVAKATKVVDGFTLSSNMSSDQADKYRGALELLSSMLDHSKGSLDRAREGMLLTGNEIDTTTRKFHAATHAVNEFADATDALDAKLDKRASFRSYEDSLRQLQKAIRQDKAPGFTLDPSTAKGSAHQALLDTVAGNIKDYASKLPAKEQKAFLDQAEKGFDDLAKKMGFVTKGPLKALKDRLGLLDLFDARPGVHLVGGGQVKAELGLVSHTLDRLDKTVARPKVIIDILGSRALHTEGRLGPGFADGGWTGAGGKYEPAGVVHKGEFVVPQPFAARDRAMLEKMYLPGYAGGGFVEAPRPMPVMSSPGIDYDRLSGAMLRARPLHGDVTVIGDQSYERQSRRDAQLARAGGF